MLAARLAVPAAAVERQEVTFKVFQFPTNVIPPIDGNTGAWAMVPDSYAIGMHQLMDTERGHGMNHDPKNMDVRVKVGWVKGLNRTPTRRTITTSSPASRASWFWSSESRRSTMRPATAPNAPWNPRWPRTSSSVSHGA